MGRNPAMASTYNYGYKGYYTGVDPNLAAVADDDVLNLGIIHNGKKDFYF